jgi:V/A-type H+/Na+-transporting ATPase subunit I
MAVATLKRIEILGHLSERDALLECLQQRGQVELIDLRERSDEYTKLSFSQQEIRHDEVTESVEKLAWLKTFLDAADGEKTSPLAARPVLRRQELLDILRHFRFELLYNRCREIDAALKGIEKKRIELESRRMELLPWMDLDVPVESLEGTSSSSAILGVARSTQLPALTEVVESSPGAHMEVVDEDDGNAYLFFVCLKSSEEQLTDILREHEVQLPQLHATRGTVEEILNAADAEEKKMESQRDALLEEARRFAPEKNKVAALLDYFSNLEKKEGAKGHLLYSAEAFFIQGWVGEDDAANLQKTLQETFESVDVYVSAPSPDDVLPTVLDNRNPVRPFEVLTGIYGYPAYHEVDPTPFMAPFFFIFFGYCLGDALYGLTLTLFSVIALRKFQLGPQGKRFFRLLLYCGISAIIVGILTSGWLGDLFIRWIPPVWVNPMENPTAILNVALILGIIQIWVGYAVAAYGNIRRKWYFAALVDQASTFLVLAGLTGIGLMVLNTIPANALNLCLAMAAVGGVVIVATAGRRERSIAGKVGFGVLGLYNTAIGYLSDILSYSRLWALGMVTGAMAATVNLIAAEVNRMIPVVGIVFAILIFVVGHSATFLINALGAFVHTIRLQFVEFFTKFFRETGRPFRPFTTENKFTVIQE